MLHFYHLARALDETAAMLTKQNIRAVKDPDGNVTFTGLLPGRFPQKLLYFFIALKLVFSYIPYRNKIGTRLMKMCSVSICFGSIVYLELVHAGSHSALILCPN